MPKKLSLYKSMKTERGWRYCKAAFHSNAKVKPNIVLVEGVEEKRAEGLVAARRPAKSVRMNRNFLNAFADLTKKHYTDECGRNDVLSSAMNYSRRTTRRNTSTRNWISF